MNSRVSIVSLALMLVLGLWITSLGRVIKTPPRHDAVVIDGRVHSPQEIAKIVDQSQLVYTIEPLSSSPKQSGTVFGGNQSGHIFDSSQVQVVSLPDDVLELVRKGNAAATGHHGAEARTFYADAYRLDTSRHTALEAIGRTFFDERQYDSAAAYLESSTATCPIDYEARRLLGESYWYLKDSLRAVRELTIAHVLNRNMPTLKATLKQRRAEIGRPWREWTFEPDYQIAVDGKLVRVLSDTSCTGYALVKALWTAEPGYAGTMLRNTPHSPDSAKINLLEEREALRMLAASNSAAGPFAQIVADSLSDGCIYYEIAFLSAPELVLTMDWNAILQVADYVEKYH